MVTDGNQHNINGFQKLLAMQILENSQVNTRTALCDFFPQAVNAFFQQQREVHRQVCVTGGHVAFSFDNTGFQQPFLLIGKHAVAAVLNGLAAPPRAHGMQYALVLFTDRKTSPWSVRQVVDFFFNP
ncbi:hypothetical protein SDC9_168877 [bioreactor metagenome]|uniref:Uncharacterized protein n=1 Tax=bioreactor metagenome TaxID=1076179 RepID=A0A645G3M7_9ZZZZ